MSASRTVDRGVLVRQAFVELVAERGFHGASMAAVADRAGVATGTIYVHHASKDGLVFAAYRDVKQSLGRAAVDGLDIDAAPAVRFRTMWHNVVTHLAAHPERARFLIQVDGSPYAADAHATLLAEGEDPLLLASRAPDMVALLADLPLVVLYELAFLPAVRLAASGDSPLDRDLVDRLATACWRAVTREGGA